MDGGVYEMGLLEINCEIIINIEKVYILKRIELVSFLFLKRDFGFWVIKELCDEGGGVGRLESGL